MLGNSIKNDCSYLYLHPKPFRFTSKSSSHLTSISRRCPVTLSTHAFSNINPTKWMTNLLIVWKVTEKDCNDLNLYSFTFNVSCRSFSFLMALFSRGRVNLSTPTFGNMNLTKTVADLTVNWKFIQKWLQESLFAT